MLYLFSRELWQSVRYSVRGPQKQSELWFWTAGDFGGDVRLRSLDKDATLSTLLGAVSQTARGPVSVVAACSKLSRDFEHVIECLMEQPGNLRVSVMLTSSLNDAELERCRSFFSRHPHLSRKVYSFFLSAPMDTESETLQPEDVFEQSVSFLRFLCQGGETLAERLGMFRVPLSEEPMDPDESGSERFVDFQKTGNLGVFGIRSWIPPREKIIRLTESLLTKMVADEEKRAAFGARIRSAAPTELIGRALYLGQTDELLSCEDFDEQIPEPPPSPLKGWKVPVSRERARKERRHIQRVVQREFAGYTEALKNSLDEITGEIYQQSTQSFSEAAATYRTELLERLDMGNLSLLVRNYFPAFNNTGETPLAGPTVDAKGWLPHESLDCFSQVYDAMEEGLDRMPSSRSWMVSGILGLAFLWAAWSYQASEITWIPVALALAGVMCPIGLWAYRRISLWGLRKQLVDVSNKTFWDLRRAFDAEVQWVIQMTGVQLERDIRKDALSFGERLRKEFDTMPWLTAVGAEEHDGLQEEICQLRAALTGIGVDEIQLDRFPQRLESLANRIVEKARSERHPDEGSPGNEVRPHEVAEEWLDELAGTAVLPLDKVPVLEDQILETAGSWRLPPLMAPLTDAELHRGYRKVVVVPDTDIVYQHLQEALPSYSGNPVVMIDSWSGAVPGVAVCSVMTGLPETILEHQLKDKESGVFANGHSSNGNGNREGNGDGNGQRLQSRKGQDGRESTEERRTRT